MVKAAPAPDRTTAQAAEAFITASRALVGIAIRSNRRHPPTSRFPARWCWGRIGPQGISQLADQLAIDQSMQAGSDQLQRLRLIARQQ